MTIPIEPFLDWKKGGMGKAAVGIQFDCKNEVR